ncbi:MAG: Trk system potassium transporter TrkA [Candidatus Delongbacteria bacterium]|nr:Trk system potassium transporter TrkA [Candidatus Delongbacteria bacterium]
MKVVIVGLGEVGSYLAEILSKEKHDVVGIDMDRRKLSVLEDLYDLKTIEGYGASPTVLKRADIQNADIFLAVSNNDEVNIVAALIAQRFGAGFTVARVSNPYYLDEEELGDYGMIGIDLLISPERRTALTIFQAIEFPQFLKVNTLSGGKVHINQLLVSSHSHFAYKKIKDLELSKDLLIVGIIRKKNFLFPNGDTTLFSNDTIFMAGKREAMQSIDTLIPIQTNKIKRIVILGASAIGYYLAKLVGKKKRLVLIEPNNDKSNQFAHLLPDCLIINGNIFESSFLEEMRFNEHDYVIAASENDEINFLASILIRDHGVKMIACINHQSGLLDTIEKTGIQQVFSPRLIISNDILRTVRERDLISVQSTRNISAEFVEFRVQAGAPIIQKKISRLTLPPKTLLISVVREDEVIIVRGDVELHAQDKVVVLCSHHQIKEIEKWFKKA